MKIEECIRNISTTLELKRIASAYVVDSRNLGKDDLTQALAKASNQYCSLENVKKAYFALMFSEKRHERVLSDIILNEILLNKDGYSKEQKLLDEEVITYEQDIINISNELDDKLLNENNKFFMFVLECAWENNDVSIDEKNLIEKIRMRFGITQKEYRVLEAKLGKFPKENNEPHNRSEIDSVRKSLQQYGLLFSIRDSKGVDFDIIPDEIAENLKIIFGKEISDYGYRQLLLTKYLRSKDYLSSIIGKAGLEYKTNSLNLSQLQQIIFDRIKPSNLLGGFSPKDGLEKDSLSQWCSDLKLQNYGTKNEIIFRIINYYDNIKKIEVESSDPRETLFMVYESLAKRDSKFLRQQGIISKDLECEHKFEAATNYLFEKMLRHKPLILTGTEHPDGILSYQNKLIMWDNKSKETPVKLKDHIIQFERYIKKSEKPVSVFMVIAAEFTDDSVSECVKYSLHNDTAILLLRAEDLKDVATKWYNLHKDDEETFNLGYFKQNGRFNKEHIEF